MVMSAWQIEREYQNAKQQERKLRQSAKKTALFAERLDAVMKELEPAWTGAAAEQFLSGAGRIRDSLMIQNKRISTAADVLNRGADSTRRSRMRALQIARQEEETWRRLQ